MSREELIDNHVQRRLRDYRLPVEGGPALKVSHEEDAVLQEEQSANLQLWDAEGNKGWHCPGGMLAVNNVAGLLVMAPSVFSKSGWVVRKLANKELPQLWDLAEAWKHRLEAGSTGGGG
jgi:hypothetical protein